MLTIFSYWRKICSKKAPVGLIHLMTSTSWYNFLFSIFLYHSILDVKRSFKVLFPKVKKLPLKCGQFKISEGATNCSKASLSSLSLHLWFSLQKIYLTQFTSTTRGIDTAISRKINVCPLWGVPRDFLTSLALFK